MRSLIIGLMLCVGCTSATEEVNEMGYYKDGRTGLCFAYNRTYGGHPVFTNVPCTPEVEFLIRVGREKK